MAPGAEAEGFHDSDPIQPSRIEHKVDDIIIDGQIEQSYNFIDYAFEGQVGSMRVRMYLHTSHSATLYPPMQLEAGQPPQLGEDWGTREAIIRYLSRRFIVIKEINLQGVAVVWMATHARRYLEHWDLSADD